jgi:hypothetical protein
MQFTLKMAVLECFFVKYNQGILGVKINFFASTIWDDLNYN